MSERLIRHVVNAATGEEWDEEFTDEEMAEHFAAQTEAHEVRERHQEAIAALESDIAALHAGEADDETVKRLLAAMLRKPAERTA